MIRSSCFCSVARRRAFARISSTDIAAVSSIKIRASANLPSAFPSRAHSSFERKPLRNFCASTLASEHKHAHRQSFSGHFQTEYADDGVAFDSRVLRQRQRETRLTHRRSRGDHHEILLLQAGSQRIKAAKPGRDAGDHQIAMLDGLGLFQYALSRMLDVFKALANAFISQREDGVLGMIEDVLRLVLFFQRLSRNFVRDPYELAQQRLSANDFRSIAQCW